MALNLSISSTLADSKDSFDAIVPSSTSDKKHKSQVKRDG